jgi:formylglycine-generating enzyme required for sulfatase activity
MKTNQVLLLTLLALCTLPPALSIARAQGPGTAFTYQGRLNTNAVPANGCYDFQFSLYPNAAGSPPGTQLGSTLTITDVGVTNGLFIATLDFGDVFTGNPLYLAMSVRSSGAGSYALMSPLQELTPTPYAVFAETAGNVSGTILLAQLPEAVVTNNATNVSLIGTFSGNGGGLTNLNAAELTGFSPTTPPANGYPILNMVWIVPGTFIMGAPTSDLDYAADETQHVVTLTNGFWMGQHPVTQGEYLAIVGTNPSTMPGDLNRPVETVTWYNATNYCYLLTQNEESAGRLPAGWVYRLPTESEWEYCCRAQTTSRFYFGNDPGDGTSLTNYAWYSTNSGNTTHPVGQLLPNAWGLVDMVGNVWQWCQDWYGSYPTANVSYNPQGPASGTYRVYRGGNWSGSAAFCRSADRFYDYATDGNDKFGIRVVLAPGQ